MRKHSPTPDVDAALERLERQLRTLHSKTPEKLLKRFTGDLLAIRSSRSDATRRQVELLVVLIATLKLANCHKLVRSVAWGIITTPEATRSQRRYALSAWSGLGW